MTRSLHSVADCAVDPVQEVSGALDRVRLTCEQVGVATLIAEVRSAAPDAICATLEELNRAARRALDELLKP